MRTLRRENPLAGPGGNIGRIGYGSGAATYGTSTVAPVKCSSRIFSSPHAAALSTDADECEALANPALVLLGTIGALFSRYVLPIA